MNMEQIGNKIYALRKNKKMTQGQLANVLSVSPQTVSKWEKNISFPDISLLPIIARFFGITMDELFNYRINELSYRERFIQFMVENEVLQFGQFKLQSGRISPYYINTGKYKSASQIAKLGQFYAECIREHNIETNTIVGNTNKDIPIMIATSLVLYGKYGMDVNYSIDQCTGKTYEHGDKITLIKDTLTSGGTLKANLQNLQDQFGQKVSNIIVSVDRMERGGYLGLSALKEIEDKYQLKIYSIVTLDHIIHALENGVINGAEYLDTIKKYKQLYGELEN